MSYLLIDRIRSLEPPETATAVKCVSLSDDVFEHHFPGQPVMPGALILEALAQTGGVLIEATMRQRGHDAGARRRRSRMLARDLLAAAQADVDLRVRP